jgi:hypothetical protein
VRHEELLHCSAESEPSFESADCASPKREGVVFAPVPASVPDSRHFVQAVLAGQGVDPSMVALAVLAVSELATNAVVHAHTAFEVVVDTSHALRIAVTDRSPLPPVVRFPDDGAEQGRGLMIVDGIGDRWGVNGAGEGKQVWWERDWATSP